ncbi:MAG: hypothetical protein KKB50_01570 [Planctomycetes bacterium]|nr:hypothetical protein [Planctomycetota bacterium]
MPTHTPSYRLHKARGLAIVTLGGKDHYLGEYGSPELRRLYAELLARWEANGRWSAGRSMLPPVKPPSSYRVGRHAQPSWRWLAM